MKQALIRLHLSVFLAGFTGVLGKLILLNEALLVWYRVLITVLTLGIWLLWKKKLSRLSGIQIIRLMGIGTIIAIHWVCFYASIKIANVSIGLICFSAVGLFTAILEPILTKQPFSWVEIGLGLISLAGIYLIFHFDNRYRTGILLGIAAALLGAVFAVLNKKNVSLAPPQTLMFYELSGGIILLTALMPFYLYYFPANSLLPAVSDWVWLLVLSWLCTVLAMDLMLQSLKKVSAFTQSLSLNLEPVYGILLAFVLFRENEHLGTSFYIGFLLIAVSVMLQMLRITKWKKTA
ncbi:MAG: hypothetical protein RLZZ28_2135 [Bacteroidota bacterium]|jgi:drug/metabolite transporter (DMT)-like permease